LTFSGGWKSIGSRLKSNKLVKLVKIPDTLGIYLFHIDQSFRRFDTKKEARLEEKVKPNKSFVLMMKVLTFKFILLSAKIGNNVKWSNVDSEKNFLSDKNVDSNNV
jgi:hypothetical protein